MTIDAASIADRLRPHVRTDSAAIPLVDQLRDAMSDQEYLPIAIAIARVLAARTD